eukprot:Em0016g373a
MTGSTLDSMTGAVFTSTGGVGTFGSGNSLLIQHPVWIGQEVGPHAFPESIGFYLKANPAPTLADPPIEVPSALESGGLPAFSLKIVSGLGLTPCQQLECFAILAVSVQQKNSLHDMGLQWWFRVMGGEEATIYGP